MSGTQTEYILFLDETDVNSDNDYFCLAGFIISRQEYETKLIPNINRLKTDVIKQPHIVFHYTEMKKQRNEFAFLNDKEIREKFWLSICDILNTSDFTTLMAYINGAEYRKNYSKSQARAEYDVLFYDVINSFIHFLITHNGIGTITLESRELSQNRITQNLYSVISQTGTNIYLPNTIQQYISTINFNIKRDNSIGLQIADMIPLVFVRKLHNKSNKYTLYNIFESKLYKGSKSTPNGYGYIEILK